ncbi:hypothetical protein ACTJIJ_10320 [Niabella sp. 22666]|uniref:hypothetical protein n=1 Tax=Niabella sp. 22666 TaxID=3453954 RepID=UPI003F872498
MKQDFSRIAITSDGASICLAMGFFSKDELKICKAQKIAKIAKETIMIRFFFFFTLAIMIVLIIWPKVKGSGTPDNLKTGEPDKSEAEPDCFNPDFWNKAPKIYENRYPSLRVYRNALIRRTQIANKSFNTMIELISVVSDK